MEREELTLICITQYQHSKKSVVVHRALGYCELTNSNSERTTIRLFQHYTNKSSVTISGNDETVDHDKCDDYQYGAWIDRKKQQQGTL